MQLYSFYLSVAATAIAVAVAQDLSNLPSCAQAPALSSISSTGCQLTDFACICKDSAFLNSLTPVIQQDCSAVEIQRMFEQLCASAGVTISLPAFTSLPSVVSTQAASSPTSQASPTTDSATGSSTGSATGSTPTASTSITAASAAPHSSASSGSASTINDIPFFEILMSLDAIGVAVSRLGWL